MSGKYHWSDFKSVIRLRLVVVIKKDLSVAAVLCLGETELLRQQSLERLQPCRSYRTDVIWCLLFTANFRVGCPLCMFACARLRQRPSGACSWSSLPVDSCWGCWMLTFCCGQLEHVASVPPRCFWWCQNIIASLQILLRVGPRGAGN